MDKWDRRKRVKNILAMNHMFLQTEVDENETGEILYIVVDDETGKESMLTYEDIKKIKENKSKKQDFEE